MPREKLQITSINGGIAPTQDFGGDGTYQHAIGIDPDYSLTASLYRKSAALVPTRYEKFSSTLLTGGPNWILNTPKNTHIYVYAKAPGGSEIADTLLASDANLKAYYKMSTGALTTDSSGNSKTLTNNNSVGENSGGAFDYCADFGTANTNKSFSIADALSYAGGAYAISMWVKVQTELAADNDSYTLARVVDAATDTYFALVYQQVYGVKKVSLQRGLYGGNVTEASITTTLGTTDFHHIVGTYDGTNMHLYVDNVDSGAVAASGSGTEAATAKFSIGAP